MAAEPPRKPLDPLVKTALTLSTGLIVVTVVGMLLTAPDRSIPPYSVMAQQGDSVTVNVPTRTTDQQIEALLVRFQVAAHGDREEFARLKIRPTTPENPAGRYRRVTIYIFDNPGLADEVSLREYLARSDQLARAGFERGLRGIYRLQETAEVGALGFVPAGSGPSAGGRVLFQGSTDGG